MECTTGLTAGPICRSGTIKVYFIYYPIRCPDLSGADWKHAADLGNDRFNRSCDRQ